MFFDDATGRSLQLDAATMKDLRGVDDSYRTRYSELGTTPWTSPDYNALTTEREERIKGILTPAQYDQWLTRYGSKRPMNGVTPMPNNTPRK